MKFDSHVNKALQTCPIERQALADATAKAEGLHDERGRIQLAIEQLQTEAANPITVKRLVAGIEIEMPAHNKRDDIEALARRRDQLPELARVASRELDKAKRRLSQAVAAKLKDVEMELKSRTLKLLETATEHCRDADSLEAALQTAGLDPEFIYAVRFEAIQELRIDQPTHGSNIQARLKEVA